MNKKTNEELQAFVDKATAGDKKALESLVAGVQDLVFNLSLRMLGTFAENMAAEDAAAKTGEYPLKDKEFDDPETFLVKAAEIFRIMKPFNDYLNKALADFQMPAR